MTLDCCSNSYHDLATTATSVVSGRGQLALKLLQSALHDGCPPDPGTKLEIAWPASEASLVAAQSHDKLRGVTKVSAAAWIPGAVLHAASPKVPWPHPTQSQPWHQSLTSWRNEVDKVSWLQHPALCCDTAAGLAQTSNSLSGFFEELLGRFLLQPLTAGIHQLGGDFRHMVLTLGTKGLSQWAAEPKGPVRKEKPQEQHTGAHLLQNKWKKQHGHLRGGLYPHNPVQHCSRTGVMTTVSCSTTAGSTHSPLAHLWLQVLFNQVLPTFLPLLIWSYFVPSLQKANTVRDRPSWEPGRATRQQLHSSNTLPRYHNTAPSWRTRSLANTSLSKGPALSQRKCNSQENFLAQK